MSAQKVREMQWSRCHSEPENLFKVLREIAVQLAQLREEIGKIGPAPAPYSERLK